MDIKKKIEKKLTKEAVDKRLKSIARDIGNQAKILAKATDDKTVENVFAALQSLLVDFERFM